MSEKVLFKIALEKAMAQCSRREYCSDDIRNKLSLWGVDNDDIGKILRILISDNFINEPRYATAFVRDKFKYNKWGKLKFPPISEVRKCLRIL